MRLTTVMAGLLLLVALALAYALLQGPNTGPSPSQGVALPLEIQPRTVSARGDLAQDESSTIELFRQAAPSVVHVTSLELRRSRLSLKLDEIPQGTGSGFIWDSQGHIVTNYHVIKDASGTEVTLHDNTVWRAELIGSAPDKDLAVLKIEAPEKVLSALALGTSGNLQVGQKVFAIGNPFGLDHTLTTGVISGLGREINSVTRRPIQGVIQTDAAINPGNSGGPLLDSAGRLIGINTAIYSTSGAYAGIGFAVPVDTINRIVPQLISDGAVVRPGLGIHIGTDQLAARNGIRGVIVWDVPEGSAAASAGITGVSPGRGGRWLIGDVIVGLEDSEVRNATDLYRALDGRQVGDVVTLHVKNGTVEREVELALQSLN